MYIYIILLLYICFFYVICIYIFNNQPNSPSFNSSVYAQFFFQLIQIRSVLNLQQNKKCNTYFFINTFWKYLNLMSMLRVISGAPLFADLADFIAHSTERVARLYHNLSNCFDCTLHWMGHSFVSQLI